MKRVLLVAVFCSGICRSEVREEAVTYAGTQFRVVKLEPQQVGVVWKGEDGQPYRTFDRVQARFSKEGKTVKFLMNAGIFEPGGIPSGLHVEEGKEWRPTNTAAGKGNFFLQPNGVLLVDGGNGRPSAGIKTATAHAAFLKDMALHASYISDLRVGIQSGPMLLIDGKRHPSFQEGSLNKLHRNGAGIDSKGRIVFAITASGQMVNFWDFAGLFLSLDCKNALFLDGDISQMAVNPKGRVESNQFAAMFVVAENPLSADENPLSAHEKPLSAHEKPLSADEKPLSADEKPLSADEKPLSVDENPLSADEKPLSSDENPLSSDEKPLSAHEKRLSADEKRLFTAKNLCSPTKSLCPRTKILCLERQSHLTAHHSGTDPGTSDWW